MRKLGLLVILLLAVLSMSGCKSKTIDGAVVIEKHAEGKIYTFTCGTDVYELSIKENGDCSLMHIVTEEFEDITVYDTLISEIPYSTTTTEYSEGTLVYEEDGVTFSCVFDKQYVGMEYSEEVTDEIKAQMLDVTKKNDFLSAGDMEALLKGEFVEWSYSFYLGDRAIYGKKVDDGVQITKYEEYSEVTNHETGKKEDFVTESVEWKEDSIIYYEAVALTAGGLVQETTIYDYEGNKISSERQKKNELGDICWTVSTEYYENGNPKYYCEWGYDYNNIDEPIGEYYKQIEREYYENVELYKNDYYGIEGAVKKRVCYEAKDTLALIEEWHENGTLAREVVYQNGEILSDREYWSNGNRRKIYEYNAAGSVYSWMECDEDGSIINGYVDWGWENDSQSESGRVWCEYKEGLLLKATFCGEDGTIYETWEDSYDENGRFIERIVYDTDGSVIEKFTWWNKPDIGGGPLKAR